MGRALVLAAFALLFAAGPFVVAAMAASPDREDAIQIFNRDVSVIVGSTLRNPTAETAAEEPLFNVAGVALQRPDGTHLTWGAWSAASATSAARTVGARTEARIQLSGLVPGGLYSVFWGTLGPDSEHPGCPGVERTLPLDAFPRPSAGAPDPASFVAGADGSATYTGRTDGRLLDASQVFFSIVYQAYGLSSYPFPNRGELLTQGESCRSSFGEDAMRHLLVLQKW
jgi:hypothetical protein